MSDCKCPSPCNPCNKCPDDGEILDAKLLPADECSGPCGGCCWSKCHDNCWINIQSTNDCLIVDTSDCGVVKLTAECPKPTFVKAWDNVKVKEVFPPDDCFVDGWDCGIKGWREISSTDERVKACFGDTEPWFLDQKIVAWEWIIIDTIGCDEENSQLEISINPAIIPECPKPPRITIDDNSELIDAKVSWSEWHHITITDSGFYNNMCSVWFLYDQPHTNVGLDQYGRQKGDQLKYPVWGIFTGNPEMAKSNWIKIIKSWHYRVYWQLTVANNTQSNDLINLWRWFLQIDSTSAVVRPLLEGFYLSTAKHWEYTASKMLRGWQWITVDKNGLISVGWNPYVNAPEWWGSVYVRWWQSASQDRNWMQGWPWMTFNMECQVDLYEWDIVTLTYRCQSDMPEASNATCDFTYVWVNDPSIWIDVDHALFGWSVLSVQMISPTLFQRSMKNKIIWTIPS